MSVAFRVAVSICVVLAVAGCGGRSASYRYKLTLSLNTPEGVKTGYSVVNVRYFEVKFPMSGVPHSITGEGIYIDLGPGRRPLVALLATARGILDPWWHEDVPTSIFTHLCLGLGEQYDLIDVASATAARCLTPFEIPIAYLPDLITFADVNDPLSLMKVDPDNLIATLGPGISWRSVTLQAIDEAPSKQIERQLPWLKNERLDIRPSGLTHPDGQPVVLGRRDFIRGD